MLTAKQHAFALRILAGDGPSEAYKQAGYSVTNPRIVAINAQRTLRHPAVAALIAQERQKRVAKAQMTREDKLARLEQRIAHGSLIDRDGIKAVEVHNVMCGHNAPQEVQVFGLTELLDMVRKGRKPAA